MKQRRLRFSSDADIVRLTNARIIIIIIINVLDYDESLEKRRSKSRRQEISNNKR